MNVLDRLRALQAADVPVTGGRTLAELGGIDIAELHTPYAHQELILRAALEIDDTVAVTPSGGSLLADPLFSAGLERIGYAANDVMDGRAHRVLAHATGGPLLQQNLVAVLDGGDRP